MVNAPALSTCPSALVQLRFGVALAAQGFAAEIDALGVVKEAIENGVGIGRIATHLLENGTD